MIHCKTSWTTSKHHETLLKQCETSWLLKQCETSWRIVLSYNATISGLDAETLALAWRGDVGNLVEVIWCNDIGARCGDVGAWCETSAITRSSLRYRRGAFGDCGVGVTPQMCNREMWVLFPDLLPPTSWWDKRTQQDNNHGWIIIKTPTYPPGISIPFYPLHCCTKFHTGIQLSPTEK